MVAEPIRRNPRIRPTAAARNSGVGWSNMSSTAARIFKNLTLSLSGHRARSHSHSPEKKLVQVLKMDRFSQASLFALHFQLHHGDADADADADETPAASSRRPLLQLNLGLPPPPTCLPCLPALHRRKSVLVHYAAAFLG